MTDEIWKRDEIDSPCVKLCVVQPESRLCAGCLRSLDEIGGWASFTPERRRAIMAELPGRSALLKTRRGGRSARMTDRNGTRG